MANSVHNLTAAVREQARTVSKDTDALYRAEVDSRRAAAYEKNVAHKHQEAQAAAENASATFEALVRDLEAASQRNAELSKQVREAADLVAARMHETSAAYAAYKALVKNLPWMEGVRNATAATEQALASELSGATEREQHAKATASERTDELQYAVDEMNRLNQELRIMEEKLSGRSFTAQTTQWWSPIWVRAGLAATVVILAFACCFRLSKK